MGGLRYVHALLEDQQHADLVFERVFQWGVLLGQVQQLEGVMECEVV